MKRKKTCKEKMALFLLYNFLPKKKTSQQTNKSIKKQQIKFGCQQFETLETIRKLSIIVNEQITDISVAIFVFGGDEGEKLI